mmetsp:Transcript_48838/g.117650  ORF Transcript_48838/g.117650 Transcript_48838/m.117650 type:complete len:218 (+) Transcript_48838:382-1035(+)
MILSSSASRSKASSAPSPPVASAALASPPAARRALAAAGTLSRMSSWPPPPPRGGARLSPSAMPTNSASSKGMYRPWPGVQRKCRSPRYLPSQSVVVRALSSRTPQTSLPLAKSAGPTYRQVPSRPEWRSLTRSPTWIAARNLCSVALSDSSTCSLPAEGLFAFALSPTPTHGGFAPGPPRPRPPGAALPPPRPRPPAWLGGIISCWPRLSEQRAGR